MVELAQERMQSAELAGLRYVVDDVPGIRRRRCGKGFTYHWPDGTRVDGADRDRCEALVIPPAWTHVWISTLPDGHIQATGRDAKGRKQYRYHVQWQELRQMLKYDRLLLFGEALPTLRERVHSDLTRRGLPEEKVLATVIELMARTCIRIGNAEYARDNETFGLTTLRSDHVEVNGGTVRFGFRAKSGKPLEVDLTDRRLAKIVRQCQELHGQELFAWVDEDGRVRDVRSEDVNHYLRSISGQDFTAKEFRTWGGSTRCFRLLRDQGPADLAKVRKKIVTQTIKQVAAHLGNTPVVCRSYYVHPVVLESYEDGRLFSVEVPAEPHGGLGRSEHGLLALLREAVETRGHT